MKLTVNEISDKSKNLFLIQIVLSQVELYFSMECKTSTVALRSKQGSIAKLKFVKRLQDIILKK